MTRPEPTKVESGGASIEEPCVLLLRGTAASDPLVAGVKAANLARLLHAGFPVPEGIVLTAAAFQAHCSGNGVTTAAAGEASVVGAISEPVARALAEALAEYGDIPLAVRSSGIAEDLAGASFAGQYETILGVRGHSDVMTAINRCWASAFSRHATSYRELRSVEARPMAVLIQPLVNADVAGVAFTANPVTGDRSEVAIGAVRGLGDRLVSGQVSPDEWTVRGGQAICRSAPENAVGAREVLAVAELARRVEAHFGTPQDVEWAMCDGKLYLLQARPITTLPNEVPASTSVPIEPAPGFWERERSHFPQPLSPMFRSFLLETENRAFRIVFQEISLLLETLELREIGGWVYQRLVPLGGKDRKPPPALLWKLLVRVVPPLRSRVRNCVHAMRTDTPWQWIERWHTVWKPALVERTEAFRLIDLKGLGDEQLGHHITALNEFYRGSFEIHLRVNAAQNVLLAEFFFACRDLLGRDEARAVDLLSGLSDASCAPSRALAVLADRVRNNPALGKLLQTGDEETVAGMSKVDPDFGVAFQRYIQEFGCRPIRYELCDPTVAEKPEWVVGLLRDQLRQGYDPIANAAALTETRNRLVAEARATLASRSAADRQRFESVLSRAEQVYPVREEHGFYDSSAPMALMRYAALELGLRLASRRQIADQGDVFFLELDEALAALREGAERHELVRRRQGERTRVLAHPGPASYGTPPPPPPSFASLPPEARFAHEAVVWAIDRIFATDASGRRQSEDGMLSGISASAGSYTGPVRVVLDESQFHKVQPGDVLVCPITSPVWSVLFPSIGALVTDSGGILSHSAIIAREYRIPAVVATGNATTVLSDGQMVMVDGAAGTIRPIW